MQTSKIEIVPIILLGEDFWKGLMGWINTTMLNSGLVSKNHIELITIAKDWEDVISILNSKNII